MIGVLGATGRIGRHIASRLVALDADAVALVRRPEAADVPLPARRADLDEPASLHTALRGVDRLLLLTGNAPGQDLREAAAVDAALAAGVERIVKVSGSAPSIGPNGPASTAVAHWRTEQRIEASGMGFTFLRPSFLMQNLLGDTAARVARTGLLALPLGHGPIAMVDARDVAACAVAALVAADPADRAWHLTGPRGVALDRVGELVGARYVALPPKVAARAMARRGDDAAAIEHAVRMAAFLGTGSDGVVTDHVLRLTGSAPRSIEEFAGEHAAAFAPAGPVARLLSLGTKGP